MDKKGNVRVFDVRDFWRARSPEEQENFAVAAMGHLFGLLASSPAGDGLRTARFGVGQPAAAAAARRGALKLSEWLAAHAADVIDRCGVPTALPFDTADPAADGVDIEGLELVASAALQ